MLKQFRRADLPGNLELIQQIEETLAGTAAWDIDDAVALDTPDTDATEKRASS